MNIVSMDVFICLYMIVYKQFCYREKLPMAWGVPKQTARHQKSIFPNMQEPTKHLTLRDIKLYLVQDG